ncbi:MAG: bifunctional lysylphosphatidylglycerol flippase/synthetase MprF [Caldilineaceae bacterium]|nr:bifunctional lysylphosphatidylglycerol flippase/synthetase MprF [Caldilineaceae bacterium]
MRRWLFPLLALAAVWIVFAQMAELENLAVTVSQGSWRWLLVGMALQIVYYLGLAVSYHAALAAVDVPGRLRDIIAVTLAGIYVNTVAPVGGAANAALFVDDAARRGHSRTRAAMGLLVQMVADYGAFCLLLVIGLAVMLQSGTLHWYEITASLVLLLYIGGMTLTLTLGLWRPKWLHAVFAYIHRITNAIGGWFRRPSLLVEDWSERNAEEFIETSHRLVAQPGHLARTVLICVAAHIVNLASLCAVFLAFHQEVPFQILIAGYAMTMLFWIISPTSNGVGIVEGLMPVMLVSLGIPSASAVIISLTYRGIGFWLPMLVGFVLLRRLRIFSQAEHQIAGEGQIGIAVLATALMGLVNLASGVLPAAHDRLALLIQILPLEVQRGSRLTSVLTGFALLLLAQALWRRKRVAWWLSQTFLLYSMAAHLVKGLDYEEAALAGVLVVYLWTQRSHFQALSDPPSLWQGVRALVVAATFTLAYGVLGFYLLDRHFSQAFSLKAAVVQTFVMFAEFFDPGLQPITGFGRYFADSIYLIGAFTFGYAFLQILRPVLLRSASDSGTRIRAQRVVEQFGRSSLARFALFPGKTHWVSPAGSLIAYTVRGRVALALGDPIGPPEDMAEALAGFLAFCRRNDWQATFYQTAEDFLSIYERAGLVSLCIGHEGIVDLASFNLSGGSNKTIRANVNKLRRLGLRAEMHRPPHSPGLMLQLRAISNEWLAMMRGRELRFSMGRFDEEYVRTSLVMAVYGPDGSIVAFANLVPEYQRNEIAVDLMRRQAQVENGTMDLLFVSLFEWAKEAGYDTFNLGLSALSGVGDAETDPVLERALHYIYEHVNQFYNFKGLHEFKEKYRPAWSPRYLIFPGYPSLPAVGLALQSAMTGESFVLDSVKEYWNIHRQRKQAKAPVSQTALPPTES